MVDFARLEEFMEEAELDALMVIGARNASYITGHLDMEHWLRDVQDLVTSIPVIAFPDKSFVVGGRMEHEGLPAESYWSDMILDARLTMVAEQLKARGLHRARLGVDMDYFPASSLDKLKQLLPEAQFESADVLMCRMRASKTPEEITRIKKAITIAENASLEIQGMIKEEVAFADIAREWAKAVLDRGGYPIAAIPWDFIAQAGTKVPEGFKRRKRAIDRLPTHAEPGCMTRLDLTCCYQGYLSDQKIVICVGEPSKEAVEVYNEHRARQEFMREFIKPGMTKREVYDACVEEFKHLDEYVFWIHGVGLDVHEEPRVGTLLEHSVNVKEKVTFELNATIALEPSWLVEDMYLLKESGFERMSTLPQQIMVF